MKKKILKFLNVIVIALIINAVVAFVGIMNGLMFVVFPLWKAVVFLLFLLVEAYWLARTEERGKETS